MTDRVSVITLAHGNGGRFMRELVRDLFALHFANPLLDVFADAACVPSPNGKLVFTTDSFIGTNTVEAGSFPSRCSEASEAVVWAPFTIWRSVTPDSTRVLPGPGIVVTAEAVAAIPLL